MNDEDDTNAVWQYATYEGVERLQFQQTARMTLSKRLDALDAMISLAKGLHGGRLAVNEDLEKYKADSGDK